MDPGLLAQHAFNGLMLGVVYAMIALGFSLFFGVLDVVQFAHGDVVTVGAFAALAARSRRPRSARRRGSPSSSASRRRWQPVPSSASGWAAPWSCPCGRRRPSTCSWPR